MPELPEVETVCRGLSPDLIGKAITAFDVRRHDLRIAVPKDIDSQMVGAVITAVKRRAKYIHLYCDNDHVILMHLGMSGRVMLHHSPPEQQKHDHIAIELDETSWLIFHDPRRFGLVTFCHQDDLPTHPLLSHLGKEPLETDCDGAYLLACCQNKKRPIKQLIMDSVLLVGVGNIYASESLFRAGIHPLRPSSSLSKKEANLLMESIKIILQAAIDSGGSTLRDYVRSSGELGYFQHHFKVYDQEHNPCSICETPIKRVMVSNRSTYYCESCQQ